ncbi:AraC family transcriptional regulator, regulatory protein of adaptative response / DNA-3-methyladenine glycosylase II [Nonomuraea maritima]|uniref:DNA-3-methyladenine glycosylase II n=1 Tax=Nonomuraea maritima TaxID=683260 RepID=A0A1G9AD18_9ACTN|nr:Ada metal-binding domain-containing protein [Nonomuraea maritima]SDK24714.1 AraC family transcriptional regulator, regulatory protein of adaptative response / DNA-3-methyladenine glycosylase II [Nonomuraea maritima]
MTPPVLDFDSCYRAVSARDSRFDGRFYTAVKTTGIYCRPICPARTPSSRNVRFYRHAAAAEAAGFRPCKRCRPELSPGDPGWDLRGDLVGRALRLIDDGAADDTGVAGLARRLHVTERHLHRLFVAELGVGPHAVARTKRLLLAKQLLTETSLPITDVAFAAGFGSVRQFNATMRETYGFTPSELRATAGKYVRDPGVAGPVSLRLRLHRRDPYDVEGVFSFLAARAVPGLETADGTSYRRAVPGGTITLTPQDGHIALDVAVADTVDTRQLNRVVARCRRLLDLDAEPDAIAQALRPTSLGPLVEARPGLRVPGAFDGFELAVRAVVGQQISVAGARTLLGRIVARAAVPGGLFPPADALLDADLTGLGLTNRRVETLKELSARVADGHLDLDGGQDPSEAVAELLSVRGIGPWTASYIALRALRDPDAWPAGDLVLVKRMAALGIPQDHVERWRPWRAYAALHLWSSS